MTKTLLLTGCALMAGALSPALAAETNVQTRTNIQTRGDTGSYVEYSSDAETITKGEVERSLEKTGRTIEKTADKAVNALTGAKADANANAKVNSTSIVTSNAMIAEPDSAEKIIGKPIIGQAGERVGTVHDIILSADGHAEKLIVADGGMMSLGDKKAVFDFSTVTGRDAKGNVQTNITEDAINNAKEFSYDATTTASGVQRLEADQMSARNVIGAKIANQNNKEIGVIKDISLHNSGASNVLVAHDQFLGLGGKKALVPFDALSHKNGEANADTKFQISAEQAAVLTGSKLN